MIEIGEGDTIIGALGRRYATVEATGSWEAAEDDGIMHLLTGGGLLGTLTSKSSYIPRLARLRYRGHILRGGKKVVMSQYSISTQVREFSIPTLLLFGSSMSAGKTSAAKTSIRKLKKTGLKVLGGKLTGAGRYRDVLSMSDAGADYIFDFVDAGLPSTVCPKEEYKNALTPLLSAMSATDADLAVIEIGASPLEPIMAVLPMKLSEMRSSVQFSAPQTLMQLLV